MKALLFFLIPLTAGAAPEKPTIYLFGPASATISGANSARAGADESAAYREAQAGDAFEDARRGAGDDDISWSAQQCGGLDDSDDRDFDSNDGLY